METLSYFFHHHQKASTILRGGNEKNSALAKKKTFAAILWKRTCFFLKMYLSVLSLQGAKIVFEKDSPSRIWPAKMISKMLFWVKNDILAPSI